PPGDAQGGSLPHITALNVPFTPLLGTFLTEKFSLSGSPYPVVGIVGQDVVLPCQLLPRTWPVDMEVLWSKIEGTHSEAGYVNVHQYKNQPNLDISGDNYQRRTEMFQQEFRNGNVSLKLKRLHVTDAGTYICFVKSPTWSHEANTELQIAGEIFQGQLLWKSGGLCHTAVQCRPVRDCVLPCPVTWGFDREPLITTP
uniref:Ig-like domain-containing protein n=1 Tax=Chrysemys picta bellii TaxID=8478 RepID=A0A8C3FMD7_CHRPI